MSEFSKWRDTHFNFMTPILERYDVVRDYVVELSSGADLSGRTMYGVTVLVRTPTGPSAYKSTGGRFNQVFSTSVEADEWFKLAKRSLAQGVDPA